MVFTAWAFAGMMNWSIYTLLAGGLLTFLAAVLPLAGALERDGWAAWEP
jgi:di/tricarboxylate transporter